MRSGTQYQYSKSHRGIWWNEVDLAGSGRPPSPQSAVRVLLPFALQSEFAVGLSGPLPPGFLTTVGACPSWYPSTAQSAQSSPLTRRSHPSTGLRPQQGCGGLPGLDPLHHEAFPTQGRRQSLQLQPAQELWHRSRQDGGWLWRPASRGLLSLQPGAAWRHWVRWLLLRVAPSSVPLPAGG